MAKELVAGSAPDTAATGATAPDGGAAPAPVTKAEGGDAAKPDEPTRKARTTLELIHEKTAAIKDAASAEDADRGADGQRADGKSGEKPATSAAPAAKDDEDAVRPDDPDRFKRRVDKLTATAREWEGKYTTLAATVEKERQATTSELSELRQLRQWAEGLAAVAQHDPQLKSMMVEKKHWLWANREPTLEDLDGDQTAYAAIVKLRADAAAAGEAAEKTAAEQMKTEKAASTEKWMAALDAEADRLKAHAVFGQFINDGDLDKADAFLAKRLQRGDDEFTTYEQVFRVLFPDRVEKAYQNTGRQEVTQRANGARRLSQTPPGGPGSAPKPDPRKMRTLDYIKMKTAGLA